VYKYSYLLTYLLINAEQDHDQRLQYIDATEAGGY